jgi:integrase
MKNPNGYGSVYKLSGNRRKPFGVRVTAGWERVADPVTGDKIAEKQLYKNIGYYATREEAMMALADYNRNPFDIDAVSITFAEVYDKWSKDKFEDISQSNKNGYIASYKAITPLHSMRFVDIRADHMNSAIKQSGKGYDTKRKIKVLLSQIFEYAMQNDIVSKDYSDFVKLGKKPEKDSSRRPFTKTEIKKLFDIVNDFEIADTVLMMIYTGFRIGELLTVKSEDVHIEERYMVGGIKTEAGIDRIVPINNKIIPFIEKRLAAGKTHLITRPDGKPYKYDNYYRENWIPLMEQLGMNHKPHDGRHTFATLMSNAKADTVALQKIIGHSSYEITANLYTHKDIEELTKAIDLI